MAFVMGMATTTTFAAEYPNVLNLIAFFAPANYMSLPGYVRYRVYQKDGQWLSRRVAVSIVRKEQGM